MTPYQSKSALMVAVVAAIAAVEAAVEEEAVAAESGVVGGSSSSGMVIGQCCQCWQCMTKNRRKHVFCIKFSPFISCWMENVYHSHKNVLPNINWQNVAKKACLHAEKLHAEQYSLFPWKQMLNEEFSLLWMILYNLQISTFSMCFLQESGFLRYIVQWFLYTWAQGMNFFSDFFFLLLI